MDTALVEAPAVPAVREPAAERAYRQVKDGILTGRHAGGTLLTEGEIALAVGVSRTPVREALLRLAAEGLLRLYPKRGALVLAVSASEVQDVLEARALVEGHAAAHAGRRDRAALVAQLDRHLADMHTHAECGDAAAFIQADRAFHHALVLDAGNAVLTGFYDLLRDRQLRMGTAVMTDGPERMRTALAEHHAIRDAVAAGRPADLGAAVQAHLDTFAASLRGAR